MPDRAKNFVKFTVPTGYNSSATAITLAAADILRLPQPPFNLVWWNSTDFSVPEDDSEVEIIRVTATASTSITASRAQEETIARNHNVFAKTYKMINAWTMTQANSLTGHTRTHTFPGTGSITHTVIVLSGLITNWTEA